MIDAARHDEQPIWIALNGIRRVVLSCSPHEPEPLALGHLVNEGWVRSAADVHGLEVAHVQGRAGVTAHVDPAHLEAFEMVRRHQLLHGCGLRHALDCEPNGVAPVQTRALPGDAVMLLRQLFSAVDRLAPGGGVHAAALSDGETLTGIAVDVARHCAFDRAAGLGLIGNSDLSAFGLVTTARVSGAMAMKAARARLGWIASRSIATGLAREIAEHHGVQLLERAVARPTRDA